MSRRWIGVGRWGGRLLAIAFGVAMVGVVEFALRQFPTLQMPPFTVELAQVDGLTLRSINPDYARRFFSGVDVPGMRMTPHPYVDPLARSSLRVVVAGGSTIQGYPHPRRLTTPAYLQAMLEDVWPSRQIDVFNLGITAVSSFAVAQAVEDAMILDPDIVIVYTGHNEVYGVYGSGSLSQGGSSILAKNVHYSVMQWGMSALVRQALDSIRPQADDPPASLLRVMSAAGTVDAEDPRRRQAADNLRENLRKIAETCRANGVQLVLCTLVSNERGFAVSYSEPKLDAGKLEQWRERVQAGQRLLEEGRAREALVVLDAAARLGEDSATVQFYRARCLELLDRDEAAHTAYVKARDLDTSPWRAASALNEVIRDIASERALPLADIDRLFHARSPMAGIGWDLMADHLHPSAAGQMLLARGLATALIEASGELVPEPDNLRTDEVYRSLQGDTPLERLAVLHDMQVLLSEEPLSRGNEKHTRELAVRADSLWSTLVDGERSGYRRWRQGNGSALLALNAADQLFAQSDFARAEQYYWASRREEPYTPWGDMWATLRWGRCRKALAGVLEQGEREEIVAMVGRLQLVAQSPDFTPGLLAFFSGYAEYLLGLDGIGQLEIAVTDASVRRLFFYDLLALLCQGLLKEQRYDDAERYVREVTGEQGQGAYGRFLLAQIAAHKKR
jgi:lysophospholipase L1-like esterase